MAPTPVGTTHRMVFTVSVNSLNHELHYFCNAEETVPGSGTWRLQNNDTNAFDVLPSAAADGWWAIVRVLYPSSVTAVAYSLEQYFSGVWVPVNSGVFTNPAGVGGSVGLCHIFTTTFKDATNRKANFIIPEIGIGVPYRQAATAGANALEPLATSILDESTPGEVGYWVKSRGGYIIRSGRFTSGTVSKKLRRARNFL